MIKRRFQIETNDDEANYAPIVDVMFVVLLAVLLRATFSIVQVSPETANNAAAENSNPVTPISVQVNRDLAWIVDGQLHPPEVAQSALQQALKAAGPNAKIALSFDTTITSLDSWEIRARLEHEWKFPFSELPPTSSPSNL